MQIVAGLSDSDAENLILNIIEKEKFVVWDEMVKLAKEHGLSVSRLRRIVLDMIERGEIIELTCRIFTKFSIISMLTHDEMVSIIVKKLKKIGKKKCGKPLAESSKVLKLFKIRFNKNSEPEVIISCA